MAHLFFLNCSATTEIYTLSLHDALPILARFGYSRDGKKGKLQIVYGLLCAADGRSESTRLNSSHRCISYAVFCLKKKKRHRVWMESRNTARTQCITTYHRTVQPARRADN